jgi:hypothetical protein
MESNFSPLLPRSAERVKQRRTIEYEGGSKEESEKYIEYGRPAVALTVAASSVHVRVMARSLVVLAQQVFAVVVAVRRADDDVNVVFVRLFIFAERLTGLMVKLEDKHGAMNPIIKDAVFFHAAHPGKVRFPQMSSYFLYLYLRVLRPQSTNMNID